MMAALAAEAKRDQHQQRRRKNKARDEGDAPPKKQKSSHTRPTSERPLTQTKLPSSLTSKSARGKAIEGSVHAANPPESHHSSPRHANVEPPVANPPSASEGGDLRLSVWDRSFEPLSFLTHNFKIEELESYYNEKGIIQMGQEAAGSLLHAANLFAYTVGKAKIAADAENKAWGEVDVKTREAANLKNSLSKYSQQNRALKEELTAVRANAESKLLVAEKQIEDLKIAQAKLLEGKTIELAQAQERFDNLSATLAEFKNKYVTLSAQNFKAGFEACQEQVLFLAPNFDMSAMGPFKEVTPEGIVGPDLPQEDPEDSEDDDEGDLPGNVDGEDNLLGNDGDGEGNPPDSGVGEGSVEPFANETTSDPPHDSNN